MFADALTTVLCSMRCILLLKSLCFLFSIAVLSIVLWLIAVADATFCSTGSTNIVTLKFQQMLNSEIIIIKVQ